MLSAGMRDLSPKNLTTTFSKPVVGCPVKFWILNGALLGMAVLYASFVAPRKETAKVDLSGHLSRAVSVANVAKRSPSPDYGLLGTGSADEVASTPESGATDKAAGTPAPQGTSAETTSSAAGTQAGNAEEPAKQPTYLIYFTATWCGPCRSQKPVIEAIKEAGKYKVHIVDIDQDRNSANAWGISSVPVVAVVRDGKVVYRGNGAGHSREFLESQLEGR